MSRIIREFLIVGFVAAVGAATFADRAPAAEGEAAGGAKKPCTIATKGDSPVAKACADGGLNAAKAAMKDLVKKAKANGAKFVCDDCHMDDPKYTLMDGAKEKFQKLMAAASGKK